MASTPVTTTSAVRGRTISQPRRGMTFSPKRRSDRRTAS